jgi:threonine dehydrogenase-like Zn-dependent dehydrogenase
MSELQTALDLIANRSVDAGSWVTQFPLGNGVEAFQRMLAAKGNDVKAVLRPH